MQTVELTSKLLNSIDVLKFSIFSFVNWTEMGFRSRYSLNLNFIDKKLYTNEEMTCDLNSVSLPGCESLNMSKSDRVIK